MSPFLRELVVSPASTVWPWCSARAGFEGQLSPERCPQPGLPLRLSAHWRWLSTGSSAPGLTCCRPSCQVLKLNKCRCCRFAARLIACLFNTITAKKIMLLGFAFRMDVGKNKVLAGQDWGGTFELAIPLPAVILRSHM